jgi:glycosyltransferase involved in cell wall biosynthesis
MENSPQVAIMMPVYNGEKTLPLAIASLLHQTYLYWKCYIVNDGSTDGTKGYLDSLNDVRFVIIHFENNKGRPYARQAALDIAEGKYLAFLDADDFYHPQKLEKQIEAFDKNRDIDLVSCGMASFDHRLILRTVRSNQFISY